MSKPLPTQSTFAGLGPPWNLTNLDANFTGVWGAINDIGTYGNVLTDTGAANAIVVSPPSGLTLALGVGLTFDVTVANTNTSSAVTLNANGTGAFPVVGRNGFALPPGAVVVGQTYRFIYSSSTWYCQNPTTQPSYISYATNPTTRTSTTTLIDDPYLQFQLPSTGTYLINFVVFITAASPGGFEYQLTFGGTNTSTPILSFGIGNSTFQGFTGTQVWNSPYAWSFTSGAADWMWASTSLIATALTSGLASLRWAQHTSSGTGTTVGAGSYMQVVPLF
jgi:hypothetical protein